MICSTTQTERLRGNSQRRVWAVTALGSVASHAAGPRLSASAGPRGSRQQCLTLRPQARVQFVSLCYQVRVGAYSCTPSHAG
eukprot:769817-Rhodomonas_salina.2